MRPAVAGALLGAVLGTVVWFADGCVHPAARPRLHRGELDRPWNGPAEDKDGGMVR